MALFNEVLRLFTYNEDTGELIRRINSGKERVGDSAGSPSTKKYYRVYVAGKYYPRSHLVWVYHTGSLPTNYLDHVDRDRQNDRIENLQEVTYLENCRNKTRNSNNKSGMSGVSWHKKASKWRAFITIDAKQVHLGLFIDLKAAIDARLQANADYGFSDTHGT